MKEFNEFTSKTYDEIATTLIDHYRKWQDKAEQNVLYLKSDSRSTHLRNRGKEIAVCLTAIEDLLSDLGIDVDELED